jgi:Flp pilus assembly pilin Flp
MVMRASQISSLLGCTRAATVIEYALIGSLISIAIYAAATTIGTHLSSTFSIVAASF